MPMDNLMNRHFRVDPEVLRLGVRVRGAFACGLDNRTYHPELKEWLQQKGREALALANPESMAGDSVLEGFRKLHANIGKIGKRWLSSPENMLNNMLRTGRVPSINPVVDIYNAISLETRLALGAHDLANVEGNINLRILDGSEKFVPLGSTEPDRVQKGEYGYCDDSNEVLCRMEIRQVEKSKVGMNTVDCFLIIQGHEAVDENIINRAAAELGEALTRYCNARVEPA